MKTLYASKRGTAEIKIEPVVWYEGPGFEVEVRKGSLSATQPHLERTRYVKLDTCILNHSHVGSPVGLQRDSGNGSMDS